MEYKASYVKIDEQGFNSCPKRKELVERISGQSYQPIDLIKKEFWANKYDTLVVLIKNPEQALNFVIELNWYFNPDEIQHIKTSDGYIIRVWWD